VLHRLLRLRAAAPPPPEEPQTTIESEPEVESDGVVERLDELLRHQAQLADTAQSIAGGNLARDVVVSSEDDTLGVAFREMLAGSKRPLKDFLMDQTRVAGLGNIYSGESLWHARLDPRRRAKSLEPEEARRLHKAIVSVLARALECCLHPAPDFRDSQWWFQGLEKILRVYGREGEPCRRCDGTIQRIEQGGRSTYFCRRCQK